MLSVPCDYSNTWNPRKKKLKKNYKTWDSKKKNSKKKMLIRLPPVSHLISIERKKSCLLGRSHQPNWTLYQNPMETAAQKMERIVSMLC